MVLGLPDWPGIRVSERLGGLWRRPPSMTSQCNRRLATVALPGDGSRAAFDADLAAAGASLGPHQGLGHAARMMGVGGRGADPGWLEIVLSWPHRIIGPAADEAYSVRRPDSIGPR